MDRRIRQTATATPAEPGDLLRFLDRARTAVRPAVHINQAVVERFGATMRENLTTGAVPFRKAVITSVVDRIEVDDHEIRIIGDQGTLERAVLGGTNGAAVGPGGGTELLARRPEREGRRGVDGVAALDRRAVAEPGVESRS